MKKRSYCFFSLLSLVFLFGFGCCPYQKNFVGMSREEVANELERGPRMKNGSFRVLYSIVSGSSSTLVHHYHRSKISLLKDPNAMNSSRWRVYYHLDKNNKWYSYILDFEKNIVVKQQDRWQPYWTMAEPK